MREGSWLRAYVVLTVPRLLSSLPLALLGAPLSPHTTHHLLPGGLPQGQGICLPRVTPRPPRWRGHSSPLPSLGRGTPPALSCRVGHAEFQPARWAAGVLRLAAGAAALGVPRGSFCDPEREPPQPACASPHSCERVWLVRSHRSGRLIRWQSSGPGQAASGRRQLGTQARGSAGGGEPLRLSGQKQITAITWLLPPPTQPPPDSSPTQRSLTGTGPRRAPPCLASLLPEFSGCVCAGVPTPQRADPLLCPHTAGRGGEGDDEPECARPLGAHGLPPSGSSLPGDLLATHPRASCPKSCPDCPQVLATASGARERGAGFTFSEILSYFCSHSKCVCVGTKESPPVALLPFPPRSHGP